MNAGKTIKELRLKNNLTQQQLAGRLRISRNAYMAWENNKVAITMSRLNALCEIFNITVHEFFIPGETPPPPEPVPYDLQKLKIMLEDKMRFLKEQNTRIIQLNRKLSQIMREMNEEQPTDNTHFMAAGPINQSSLP